MKEELLSKRLKIIMIEKGIRNFDMAKHLGVDPSKVSKIVNGWIEPDETLKKRIAEYLGVPQESIWGNTDRDQTGFGLDN